jgi:hypothetical protein
VSLFALGPLRAFYDLWAVADSDDAQSEESAPLPTPSAPTVWDRDWLVRDTLLVVAATPFVALVILVVSVVVSLTLVLGFGILIVLFPWLVFAYAAVELARQMLPAFDAWATGQLTADRARWRALLLLMPALEARIQRLAEMGAPIILPEACSPS